MDEYNPKRNSVLSLGASQRSSNRLKLLGLVATRLTMRDLVVESWRSVSRDYVRSLFTVVGTLIGCAAFVATIGITGTAGSQISSSFDIRRATEVTVSAQDGTAAASTDPNDQQPWFTNGAVRKVRSLAGVKAAGRVLSLSAMPIKRFFLQSDPPASADLYGLDVGALAAASPKVVTGRGFDAGHDSRSDHVVMLSLPLAKRLGLTEPGSAVFIGDVGYTVIGIYDGSERIPGLAGGFIMPIQSMDESISSGDQTPSRQILIETVPGAAAQVGVQAPYALAPAEPDNLKVVAPPDPKTLRNEIESNVTQLSLIVSLVALAVGMISIANSAAVSIVVRTPEIGLRRALGARRTDIFLQLLGETVALGTFGGVLGAVLGLFIVVVTSLVNRWVPVLDIGVLALAVAAGTVAGILAGLWPAAKATVITPAEALAR